MVYKEYSLLEMFKYRVQSESKYLIYWERFAQSKIYIRQKFVTAKYPYGEISEQQNFLRLN